MPTIEEIKELLKRVREKTQLKKTNETSRPSPLPPMSPFTTGKPIQKQKEIKSLDMTPEIVKNIYKAGY